MKLFVFRITQNKIKGASEKQQAAGLSPRARTEAFATTKTHKSH